MPGIQPIHNVPARRSAEQMVTTMTDEEHAEMKAKFRTYSLQRNQTILATKKNKTPFKRSDTSIALPDLQCHYLEELPEDVDVIKKGDVIYFICKGLVRLRVGHTNSELTCRNAAQTYERAPATMGAA